jgi:hypothetical protein
MKTITLAILAMLVSVSPVIAQIAITTTGSNTQNFNALASTGTSNAWTDNSTIASWYSQRSGTGTTYEATTGGATAGNMYSFGSASSSDRAMGSIGSGNASAGNFSHGVQLRNTSGTTVTSMTVTYTLEQWRKSGVTTGQAVTVWYKKSTSPITALNPNANGTWTQITALTTTSPINTATAATLDGNAAANRVTLTNISIPSLSLANNEYIMIKWEDPDHTGSDHSLGIDDVTISWTVPPLCTNAGITSTTATDNTLCPSETTSITANGVVGTNAVLTWWTGTGGTGTNLGTANPLTGQGAGTYYARVTADCGSPVEQSVTVSNVSAPSTSSITGNASPSCNAVGVSYSVSNTSGSTYAWTVPSGASITAGTGTSAITVSFGISNGNITVQETNSNGCTGSTITLAVTLSGCSIDANFTASSTSICAGATTTFTNTSTGTTGGATYSWDFGSGASPATATGIGPHTVMYSTVGQSTVVLTVVDGVTNVETKTNYITVNSLPTANAGSSISDICQGATTSALGGSFGGSATSAIWSDGGAGGSFANNGGSTPSTTTYTGSASAPSSVTLTLTTSGGGCGSATSSKTIVINSTPSAPVANGSVSPQVLNVNNTDFLANWASSLGATGYYLDVATTPTFSTGGVFLTEGFNNSMANFTGTVAYVTGNSGTGDRPASYAYANEGTHAIRTSNTTHTITSTSIDASAYSGINLSFRLAAFSLASTANGVDAADSVVVEISPDGGTTYYRTVRIVGQSNAYWSYSATGQATTAYDGNNTPVQFGPSGGGNRTSDGYSTVTITGVPSSSNLRIRITQKTNDANEGWVLDNLTLSGTGSSFVPGYENLFVNSLDQLVSGLDEEVTYYYRIRATNDCGTSGNSNVISVTTSCSAPTTAASAFSVSTVSSSSLNLSWTSGNGSSRIIVAKAGSAPTGTPSNNTTYTANTDFTLASLFGDGVVVYNGTGTTATVTGLTPGTQYFFTIYEYNCGTTREQYLLTSPPTSNNYTLPSNVVLTELCTDNGSHQLSWTFGSGAYDGVIIFARQGATSSGPGVTDITGYTGANSNYTLATDYAAKGKLVYSGSGTNVTVTGLTSGLNYTFSAFTYKNTVSTKWSSGTSVSQTITLPDVTLANASAENEQINIGWTNPVAGCYDEIMVVANTGAVSFTPTGDGTAYTANPSYTSSNQVVYKGLSTGLVVTNLTNGTNYCFRIFVRKGTEWSFGSEVCAIPNTSTNFQPGDLAIIAVNTQVLGTGSTDEVCYVSFKEITAGTSFYMTDNGFERTTADLWGDTEGVMRFTRIAGAATVPAGTVICLNGPYDTEPYYDIIVCGVLDNDNWQIDANVINASSGASSFDLNNQDQVWIMQGGSWSNPFGNHNATYNGNPLYGWSGINWKTNIGNTVPTWTTAGSRLIPGTECFTTELSTVTNNSKTKYTGPTTATSRLGWITRINNASNWTGYTSNANYDAAPAAYDYYNECIVFAITAPTETAGKWTGSKNDDWFDCANWDTKEVPDSTVNVTIENVAGANNNCNINYNATNAYLYNSVAQCNDIDIIQKELRITGSYADILEIHGDLTIGASGTLDMSDGTAAIDGQIKLFGNWNNSVETNFKQGDGTVHFIGTTQQAITTADVKEVFDKIVINNAFGILVNDPIQIQDSLKMTNGVLTNTGALIELGLSTASPGTLLHTSGRITHQFKRWITATSTDYLFPIGSATSNQNALFNFTNLTAGSLTLSFNNSIPGISGLPLGENGFTFNNTFNNGYWSSSTANGLASTGYSVKLDGLGFTGFTQDNNVRVLRRNAASIWLLNGTHTDAVGTVAQRTGMSSFGEYALAPATRCLTELSAPTILNQEICSGENTTSISVSTIDGEAPFSYQWYVNGSASIIGATSLGASNGGQTNTLTPPNSTAGTFYYFVQVSQTGSACPSVPSDFSVVIVNPAPIWYQDLDGDGYSSGISQTSCTQPSGYYSNTDLLGISGDCDDLVEDINPGADEWCNSVDDNCDGNIDDGLVNVFYYQDFDADGFRNPFVYILSCSQPDGYIPGSAGVDCNDTNAGIYPGSIEVCANLMDDNCNGQIDENCSSGPINDLKYAALPIATNTFGNCTGVVGTLAGATISAEAQSTCITGQDVWYYFTATSEATSIKCTSSVNNILLELQTEQGVLVETENVQSIIGNETMNTAAVIPGNTYYVIIRNYNSAQGAGGTFNLCVQNILASSVDVLPSNPSALYDRCSTIKADYTSANQYILRFGSSINYSTPNGNTIVSLSTVPGLTFSTNYSVTIDAVYNLVNGAGAADILTVPGAIATNIYINAQPDVDLRSQDTAPNTRPIYSYLSTNQFLCSVVSYNWSFQRVTSADVTIGLPHIVNSVTSTRYLQINGTNIPGVAPDNYYRVMIQPVFSTGPGLWYTDYQILHITPSGGMVLEETSTELEETLMEKEMRGENFATIYPNPNNGQYCGLNVVNTVEGTTQVRIMNNIGQVIYTNRFETGEGIFNTAMVFEQALASGLYMVEITLADKSIITERMVVGN